MTARSAPRGAARARAGLAWLACALVAHLASGAPARAESPPEEPEPPREPPPEAAAGDWSAERADSLGDGWITTGFSASGRAGARPRTGERVSFRADGASGTFRGGEDPLAGGRLESTLGAGTLRVGGLAPRWGCGLVLGAAAQPWSLAADDRGDGAALRGHAGDGALWRAGDAPAPRGPGPYAGSAPAAHGSERRAGGAPATSGGRDVQLLAGRFAKRTLAGARVRYGALALAALADAGRAQASAAWETDGTTAELALGERARWRAEFSLRRTSGALALTLRARGGLPALRPLAEPTRAGPARVLALGARNRSGPLRARAHTALWSWQRGVAGAVASLEVGRALGHHAGVDFGFEEQHGTRRDPALGAAPVTAVGMRQGWWCAWRGRLGGRELELRHELRGGRAFAQQAVRRVLTARAGSALPLGGALAVTHSAWTTQGGETLYLAETDSDRLTLRAANGLGQRTRVELTAPLLGGRARASTEWSTERARRLAPRWTLDWTRRTRQ